MYDKRMSSAALFWITFGAMIAGDENWLQNSLIELNYDPNDFGEFFEHFPYSCNIKNFPQRRVGQQCSLCSPLRGSWMGANFLIKFSTYDHATFKKKKEKN